MLAFCQQSANAQGAAANSPVRGVDGPQQISVVQGLHPLHKGSSSFRVGFDINGNGVVVRQAMP